MGCQTYISNKGTFQSHRNIAEAHLAQENFQLGEVVDEGQRLNGVIVSSQVTGFKFRFNVLHEKVMLQCDIFGPRHI